MCGAESAVVYRLENGVAHFVASYNFSPDTIAAYTRMFPRPIRETDYLWRIADGSVLSRIGLTARLTDGVVEISVSDTGIGIAPEDQGTIFEEFRQVGGDETRTQEGTGLGLTLTKKFVEMHGGRIWVESAVGRGSTFTFTLPIGPEAYAA